MVKFTLDRVMFEYNKIKIPELSEKCGVNKNTLYSIYNNKNVRVDLDVLNRLCKALDCSISDVIEYIPDTKQLEDNE